MTNKLPKEHRVAQMKAIEVYKELAKDDDTMVKFLKALRDKLNTVITDLDGEKK